jgi:hypothetical protein
LGFVPLALAAAPAVGGIIKGIGSIFGGKKKKKAPPPPKPAAARAVSKSPGPTAKPAAAPATALAGVPVDVKADVLASLLQYRNASDASKQSQEDLVKNLTKLIQPALAKVEASVQTAALSRKVNDQHNKILKTNARWEGNQRALSNIEKKLAALEASINGSHANTKRVFKIYGVNA